MEMSRMLLMCMVVVASVYAGHQKSNFVKNFDICEKYNADLENSPSKYSPCGVQDKNGKELCYLNGPNHVKCDSMIDCPNFADEMECKTEHEDYCADGAQGKNFTLVPCAAFNTADGFQESDTICIPDEKVCDDNIDCPQGDDEEGCPRD